jgi:two-component system, response regulator RegA
MQDSIQSKNCDSAQAVLKDTLLIVDDDRQLLQCLAQAMETRGFEVIVAATVADSLAQIEANPPAYAVVDMRLVDGCGLDVAAALKSRRPDARIVIQTRYGNIATAVRAVKIGAIDYLPKPADADEITEALLAPEGGQAKPPEHSMSASRVRWGAHPERVPVVWTQRIRNGAPVGDASAYVTADSRQGAAPRSKSNAGELSLGRNLLHAFRFELDSS